ncbi:AI-2E family transporter [bacterium]|nr:AI-2E family transporter [bacterium]
MTEHDPRTHMTFWQELWWVLKNFIQGQFLIAVCIGLTAFLAFWLMGINHAFWLGLFVGLMSFIPYLGPALGFIPPLVFAWTTHHHWGYLIGMVGVWILIQILEGLVFQPKILGDKLRIHPLLVIVSFFFWGLILGIFGVLLAVPLTAVVQILWRRWRTQKH